MSNFTSTLIKAATKNRTTKIVSVLTVLLVLVFVGRRTIFSKDEANTSQAPSYQEKNMALDTTVEIPITSDKEDKAISYKITNAQLTKNIVLKGQKANAVEGKVFLILSIKLSNKQEERVKINTRDYVRLSVNDSEERLAPGIHNDPVEVQPISDQTTRVGFSVDESNIDNLKLYVGQISEEKTEVQLSFE